MDIHDVELFIFCFGPESFCFPAYRKLARSYHPDVNKWVGYRNARITFSATIIILLISAAFSHLYMTHDTVLYIKSLSLLVSQIIKALISYFVLEILVLNKISRISAMLMRLGHWSYWTPKILFLVVGYTVLWAYIAKMDAVGFVWWWEASNLW